MKRENIFIHIPKTGGTTINTSMQNTYWGTEPNFYYRHLLLKTKRSNSADIFDPANYDKYKNYTLFMMVRDPVDRMISEYYFLKERKNFINLLRHQPRNFDDYIKNPQTQNYMVGFLLGKRIFDPMPATGADLNLVINAIEHIPIHTGIFEHFRESLNYFRQITGIQWNRKIDVKRMTFIRPEKEDITPEMRNLILEKNHLDKKLYDHCVKIFSSKSKGVRGEKITFIKSKYNHIIPYALQTCLFEFCTENKYYLLQNLPYFKGLTFYLLKNMAITDGLKFVEIWNATFTGNVKKHYPNSQFSEKIEKAYLEKSDPFEQTINIGRAIDDFFSDTNNKPVKRYYNPMKFDSGLIVVKEKKEEGFLKGILDIFHG